MKSLSNQRGQIAVEYILLLTILVVIAGTLRTYLNKQEVLATFVSKPWETLAGVIENGAIGKAGATKLQHPNFLYRHASLKGRPIDE
jgi:uncharacterized protein (UPF0333 family)